VPFNDVEAMAGRMVGLAESPELRRRFGEAGRRRIKEAYSYDGLAGRIISTYEAVAERHGRRHMAATLAGLRLTLDQEFRTQRPEVVKPVPRQSVTPVTRNRRR
jgi:hypothetical protein